MYRFLCDLKCIILMIRFMVFKATFNNISVISWWSTWLLGLDYCHIIVYIGLSKGLEVMVMVLNATFNNISVISWWSDLLVEETRVPGENH